MRNIKHNTSAVQLMQDLKRNNQKLRATSTHQDVDGLDRVQMKSTEDQLPTR